MNTDDIVAITQVMSLYGHFLDQAQSDRYREIGRPVAYEEVFVEDVAFRFAGHAISGRKGIMTMIERPGEPEHVPGHQVTNVYVYEQDGEVRVHAKWFIIDLASGQVFNGDYHNVMRRTPAGWRIASVDARPRHFPGGAQPLRI